MFELEEFPKTILIAGQNAQTRKNLINFFDGKYDCDEAESPAIALSKIREKAYPVILSDIIPPNQSGVEMMTFVKNVSPQSIAILTGEVISADDAVKSFRAGAFDYIQAPFDLRQVGETVARAFEHYELRRLRDDYQYHLESLVSERMVEVDKALEEVENSYRMTLKALVQALETRDFETHGHSERAVTFSLRLGYELGLDKEALRNLELGALLHDIGKIGVPDAILRKPAKLNEEEWDKMKMHPLHGQRILRNIPFLEGAAQLVAQHHERWDGSGYPLGLRGAEIDIGARIFAVADAFDAMISNRVYRRGRSFEAALEELERGAGTQFDASVVEAFKQIPKEDWEVLRARSVSERQEVFSFQSIVAELVNSRRAFEMVH